MKSINAVTLVTNTTDGRLVYIQQGNTDDGQAYDIHTWGDGTPLDTSNDDYPILFGRRGVWKRWFKNGLKHRDNGPAIASDDDQEVHWYREGLKHRDDGPAITLSDGTSRWYVNGEVAESFDKFIALAHIPRDEACRLMLVYGLWTTDAFNAAR